MVLCIPIFRISKSPNSWGAKNYVIITKKGMDFVRSRYSRSVALNSSEMKVYEFLIRLLSFGGILPSVFITRWQEREVFERAYKDQYVTISAFERELLKEYAQITIKEIWGKIPQGIYV